MNEEVTKAPDSVEWECNLPTLKPDVSWTVGGRQTLSCRGDYVEKLEAPIAISIMVKAPAQQQEPVTGSEPQPAPPEDPNKDYALKILELKNIDNTSGDFVVTSYRPNKYQDVEFELIGSQGKKISVKPMSWEVTSLVTKENQHGFGPTTPLYLNLPWWYWASIIGSILFIVSLLCVRFFFHLRWKGLMREMKSHESALGPSNQFYKDIRILQNSYQSLEQDSLSQEKLIEYWRDLERNFRLYLVREFQVPALNWKNPKILKFVKKKMTGSFSLRLETSLKTVFTEFQKGLDSRQKLTLKDIQQMENLCQNYIELIKKINQRGNK